MAAAVEVADVGLAGDGDHGLLVIITILGVGGIRSGIGFLLVAGRGSDGDGQESGDDKLFTKFKKQHFLVFSQHTTLHVDLLTNFMLTSVD